MRTLAHIQQYATSCALAEQHGRQRSSRWKGARLLSVRGLLSVKPHPCYPCCTARARHVQGRVRVVYANEWVECYSWLGTCFDLQVVVGLLSWRGGVVALARVMC